VFNDTVSTFVVYQAVTAVTVYLGRTRADGRGKVGEGRGGNW
jgi:hypothetical protein